MAENSSKANVIVKALFIIGGVILFILLAIFILRLVPAAISNIANIGSSISKTFKGDEIAVTASATSVDQGTPVIINFDYTSEVPGQYFVNYTCVDGFFFDIQSSNGPKR